MPQPYCHDMITLLPEYLPLAAWTTGCSAPIVISPLSSLLVYGAGLLTEEQLKQQLGIDPALKVGEYDAFKASGGHECAGVVRDEWGGVEELGLAGDRLSQAA